MSKNALYAQSGGVTAAINVTAAAVVETVRAHSGAIGALYAARHGIVGALTEDLIDTSLEPAANIAALRHTPGGAFGSCRYKLPDPAQDDRHYRRLLEVFDAHDIGYFFYNGGGDSMDTALKLWRYSQAHGYPLKVIGIPKTVDNDLPVTDCCPGFGSVAKYVAVSIREATRDLAAMATTSTQVFVLEVMGRHAGWIAAAGGLAGEDGPQAILFPEVAFDAGRFLARVRDTVARHGYCSVVASEGVRDADGHFLAEAGTVDAFGHHQLGGAGPAVAQLVTQQLGFKTHWAVADYLQRSARHLASAVDIEQAYAIGRAAVEMALAGDSGVAPVIRRLADQPYRWDIASASLAALANQERLLPAEFIGDDGFGITDACRRYLAPLIVGEAYPPYADGLPQYVRLANAPVVRRLATDFKL
ncbi:6-phosphofructokinase [Immundisolibacter sp.]|uniref:6-phosphofructokinase n=1 Tax=Immundisolibacter sp. TaxID=1934948 RepID=UPI0019A06985|nr:6-phosphofructokinase [Immundisolibacter sp.]MBC7160671.1 6-phosphofructokinase [Immundisolibacter sp.]MEA3220112.1 Pyrophosphate--fructose 6-phosphate 1-phosphotransferase [Immundisolibacter sp.]